MTPRDLLNKLMQGDMISPSELDDFLKANKDEGMHLDYKDGKITSKTERKKGAQVIRQYVSGFANSDGGVLIVGIDDKSLAISPCGDPIGDTPLSQWAARCFSQMAPLLSPLPRVSVVNHTKGPILIIAVPRSSALIWCVTEGRPAYYLRIGDETILAPEYLISDLVLGKRQVPSLDLSLSNPYTEVDPVGVYEIYGATVYLTAVTLGLRIENRGLVAACGLRCGLVTFSCHAEEDINQTLLAYIDRGENPGYDCNLTLIKAQRLDRLEPFDIAHIQLPRLLFPYEPRGISRFNAAAFLVSDNGPIQWYQLHLPAVHMPVFSIERYLVGCSVCRLDPTQLPRVSFSATSG